MLQVPRTVMASFEDCLVANNISANMSWTLYEVAAILS